MPKFLWAVAATFLLAVMSFQMPAPPTTSHAPQHQRTEGTVARPAHHDNDAEFSWTGGGVKGTAEAHVNLGLGRIHDDVVASFRSHIGVSIVEYQRGLVVGDARRSTIRNSSIFAFHNYFTRNITVNTNEDCEYRMPPDQQLLCHAWAELHRKAKRSHGAAPSPLFTGAPLHSMCSLFLGCLMWKRGRYSRRLTDGLLRATFQGLVDNEALYNSSRLMQRNLIHGGKNWREYDWLQDRLVVSRDLITSVDPSPIDVRSAFQGGELTLHIDRHPEGWMNRSFAVRDNGKEAFELTRPLTALETIAVMYHRAVSGSRKQTVLPAAPSPSTCRVPAIRVLVFSGDSIAKQLFRRLVDLVRHGPQGQVMVPYGARLLPTHFRHWPSLDHSKFQDQVLAIFPTHDEFRSFDSLLPFGVVRYGKPYIKRNDTVNAFFAAIAARRRRRYCGGQQVDATAPEDGALFYIVFLNDPITARPRSDAMAPCVPAVPTLGTYPERQLSNYFLLRAALKRGVDLIPNPPVVPLRSLGVRIGMHVHSSNIWEIHGSPNTYDWLSRMATGRCRVQGHTHPLSDETHLYLVSTMLRRSSKLARSKMRVAPTSAKVASVVLGDGLFLNPEDTGYRELARLEAPFAWVQRTATAIKAAELRRSQNISADHRDGVFFPRVRLLDMGKVFLDAGNMFHVPDGMHEACTGRDWLLGAAGYNDTNGKLGWAAKRLRAILSNVIGPSEQNFDAINLAFDTKDDCSCFGTLLTLNAMLIDVIGTARHSSPIVSIR
jgi:hypothetical protein